MAPVFEEAASASHGLATPLLSPLRPLSPVALASSLRPPQLAGLPSSGPQRTCLPPPPLLPPPPPPPDGSAAPTKDDRLSNSGMWEEIEQSLVALLKGGDLHGAGDTDKENEPSAASQIGEMIKKEVQRLLEAQGGTSGFEFAGARQWSSVSDSEQLQRRSLVEAQEKVNALRGRCESLEMQRHEAYERGQVLAERLESEQRKLISAQELHGRLLWSTAARRSLAAATTEGVSELRERIEAEDGGGKVASGSAGASGAVQTPVDDADTPTAPYAVVGEVEMPAAAHAAADDMETPAAPYFGACDVETPVCAPRSSASAAEPCPDWPCMEQRSRSADSLIVESRVRRSGGSSGPTISSCANASGSAVLGGGVGVGTGTAVDSTTTECLERSASTGSLAALANHALNRRVPATALGAAAGGASAPCRPVRTLVPLPAQALQSRQLPGSQPPGQPFRRLSRVSCPSPEPSSQPHSTAGAASSPVAAGYRTPPAAGVPVVMIPRTPPLRGRRQQSPVQQLVPAQAGTVLQSQVTVSRPGSPSMSLGAGSASPPRALGRAPLQPAQAVTVPLGYCAPVAANLSVSPFRRSPFRSRAQSTDQTVSSSPVSMPRFRAVGVESPIVVHRASHA